MKRAAGLDAIPYGRQTISEADVEAVTEVLRSAFLTQGPLVPKFEERFAELCGAEFSVATSSATAALHIACRALDVGPGDIVWTSPVTFVASANCALYCGADVDFVDIDERTYNISVAHLSAKLAQAEKQDRLPKVVIPVHLCGQACDMAGIHELSQRYGFRIIEDASHAVGGRYRGERIGNCRYSDISVFSFHPVKVITTGEGGLATTNSSELAGRMRLLRSHGITRDPSEMIRPPHGPWYYEQTELGFNYRLTDIQAALGLSQVGRLDEFVSERHRLAAEYNRGLAAAPVIVPWQHPDSYSALHLYVVRLDLTAIPRSHLSVFESLRATGIGVNLHYMPVYLQPFYERLGFKAGYCPAAERYYAEAISLPIFPGLTAEQQNHVMTTLKEACSL